VRLFTGRSRQQSLHALAARLACHAPNLLGAGMKRIDIPTHIVKQNSKRRDVAPVG